MLIIHNLQLEKYKTVFQQNCTLLVFTYLIYVSLVTSLSEKKMLVNAA
jgi:hypothetical protein